jgi:hypothetical protein
MNDGFSILDFGDLPPDWRTVLRLVLRGNTMTDMQLWAAVEALPEAERMTRNTLDEVLSTLCNRRWLMMNVDNQRTFYRVNLRRRTAHALAHHIWNALGVDKTEAQPSVMPLRRGGNRKLPDNLWSVLDSPSDAPAPKPERKNSVLGAALWDKALSDDKPAPPGSKDETLPHRPAPAPRKSVWDALAGDDKPKDKPEN